MEHQNLVTGVKWELPVPHLDKEGKKENKIKIRKGQWTITEDRNCLSIQYPEIGSLLTISYVLQFL